QALAKLRATKHADAIRQCLSDPDADVRREAKKALKKLGVPSDEPAPPPPVHLLKGRGGGKIPPGLEEWSQNLEMNELEPILAKLATYIDRGFGKPEIAEVLG